MGPEELQELERGSKINFCLDDLSDGSCNRFKIQKGPTNEPKIGQKRIQHISRIGRTDQSV